jgi:hypothetical protein
MRLVLEFDAVNTILERAVMQHQLDKKGVDDRKRQ